MTSNLMHAAQVEAAIADTCAKLEAASKRRPEIEALLVGDPDEMRRAVNQQTGRIYNNATAAKKLQDDLADLDREIARFGLTIEKLKVDLEKAKVRDEQARQQAAEAAQLMAQADEALAGKGEAYAAALRDLIRAGSDALTAMEQANAALPEGEQIEISPMLERLRPVPERVVSKRNVEVWLDEETGAVVPEDRLDVNAAWGNSLEALRKKRIARIRDEFKRAHLTPMVEITVIPAHKWDWLNPGMPATQVRHEKVAEPSGGYRLTEDTIGDRRGRPARRVPTETPLSGYSAALFSGAAE